MKTRRRNLTRQEVNKIGKWKEKNPNASFTEVASIFDCSYDQARDACGKYCAGETKRTQPEKNSKPVETGDASEIDVYSATLKEVQNDVNMDAKTKVGLLDKLLSIKKKLQSIELTSHLKSLDSEVIAAIIRRYEPDATDEEVIKIFLEELEKCKALAR